MPNQENKPELLEGRLLHLEVINASLKHHLKRVIAVSGCRHCPMVLTKQEQSSKQYFIFANQLTTINMDICSQQ
jgi:hypothetical protein